MIRVLVVDKVHLVCEVVASTIEHEPDMVVAGLATTVDDTLALLSEVDCDLVLISTTLPDNGALTLTERISEAYPDVKILIMGMIDAEAVIMRYIEAGASGYVLKEDPVEELLRNVRATFDEKALVSPQIAATLMTRIAELTEQLTEIGVDLNEYEELTPREKEVLDLIGEGHSNQEIADELTIELGTVKNHVHNILNKLNVNSRKDAAMYLTFFKTESVPEENPENRAGESGGAAPAR